MEPAVSEVVRIHQVRLLLELMEARDLLLVLLKMERQHPARQLEGGRRRRGRG
jgi:hypothetical protein